MHEFVLSAARQKKRGVQALDIAKRLLDFGFHAPTVYFPLIVPEAMMIEPTETETRETLDEFIAVMRQIAREAAEEPEVILEAPHDTLVGGSTRRAPRASPTCAGVRAPMTSQRANPRPSRRPS